MDTRPIGVFDSGVGGMTVLREIKKKLPNENFMYLGDTKNFPYGDKSEETIIKLATKCTKFLTTQNVKILVIACGTATSQALEAVKEVCAVPVMGIISPTIEYLKENQKQNHDMVIGVIATEGTIRSQKWKQEIQNKMKDIKVISKACPLLAPMAEQGWIHNAVAKEAIKEYMKPFQKETIHKMILGCTHYPLFKELIQKELGNHIEIIDTGEKIASRIQTYLTENNMKNNSNQPGACQYYLTDTQCNFVKVASHILQDKDIQDKIQKIDIE